MTLPELESWLGLPLFMVPCRPGTKRPMVKYTQQTLESTQRPAYRAMLDGANVAVRLGEHSGGFCAIDFDDDDSLAAFLAVNPALATSARWKGSRGAQIGVRIDGPFPGNCSDRSKTETVEVNGKTLGKPLYEWRATNNLSTVKGIHPSGCQYQVLVPNPPVRLKFEDIRWPEGWKVPGAQNEIHELIRQYGQPWAFTKVGGTVHAVFFAALYLHREDLLWDTTTGQFYLYHPDRGIWIQQARQEIGRRLAEMVRDVILKHVAAMPEETRLPGLLSKVTSSFIDGALDLMQHLAVERDVFRKPDAVVHTENVMVDLRARPYGMHGFGKEWMSRNQCPVRYVAGARSAMWQAFLDHALPDKDDQKLLQHWGGLALMQRNRPQVMLLLTGTGGGGKSTVAGVVRRLVGDENVGELRTQHLGGRFEAATFFDRTLLLGSDVAPDFLSCEEAAFLKALTGGDRISVEFKGRNTQKQMVGDWNVLVTANSRLRVNIQGDMGAWARRLLLLDFCQPKPAVTIPNYHDVLIQAEGPGILNWFLAGAESLSAHLDAGRTFPVTPAQRKRIDDLLSESDSIRFFIVNHVKRSAFPTDCITSEDLFTAYLQMCSAKDWASEPQRRFQLRANDLMLEVHQAMRSKHLDRDNREDSGQRGYAKVTLCNLEDNVSPEDF
jgi:putative DNA primase/helicase